jgi:hypothetical protein
MIWNMISPLRARVIEVLEAVGFHNSENHLPVQDGPGTFSVIGGSWTGVNVSVARWDASAAELEELREAVRQALEGAGLTVVAEPRRLYVPPDDSH